MSSSIMWFSIVLMVAALLLRKDNKLSEMICGAGWLLFGVYWVTLIPYFYSKPDYTNIVLVLLLFGFCLLVANFMAHAFKHPIRKSEPKNPISKELDQRVSRLFNLTKLIAIVCIIYMPFSLINPLNQMIIGSVASQTVSILNLLGYNAVQLAYNTIGYSDIVVTVILACTAIESIAFFTGLILSVPHPNSKRKSFLFFITVPVIYLMNLARNIFIVAAYGDMWFGPNSFEIAHTYIAKAASGIALVVLAYVAMRLLPELMDMVVEIFEWGIDEVKRVLRIKPKGN
jgi:Predicted membrane protein